MAGYRKLAPVPGLTARPGETAFVLGALDPDPATWRYLGTARQDDTRAWQLDTEVDFTTWRALGRGRSASRPLPAWAEKQAPV